MMTVNLYIIHLLCVLMHPFHVSVCEIKHEEKEKLLEITIKIFADDLESALSQANDHTVSLNAKDISSHIEQYVCKRFILSVNNKKASYQILGWEQESDAVWVYLEYKL